MATTSTTGIASASGSAVSNVSMSVLSSSTAMSSSAVITSATKTLAAAEETVSEAGDGYTYSSSTIVRVALAASIIVVVVFAALMAIKISSWLRYNQRMRRESTLRTMHEQEQRAHAFELAAWADQPGTAPVQSRPQPRQRWWKRHKESEEGEKTKHRYRRGKVNAYAVYEWEGAPA